MEPCYPPRATLTNPWAHVVLLPQPPKQLVLQEHLSARLSL